MTRKQNAVIYTLDVQGLTCPEPVMLLHTAIRDAVIGDTIIVNATDPSTQKDIPKFCQFLGHTLINSGVKDGMFFFEIQKGQ